MKRRVTYIVSDINKAFAFEWIADNIDLVKFDLSFIFILQGPSETAKVLADRGIKCHVFYYKSKKDLVPILFRVYGVLKQTKTQVVHCHLLYGSLVGLTAARMARIKSRIYTRHHSDFHHRYFKKGVKWDNWCNRMASVIVAPSQIVKEILVKKEQAAANKVRVIFHGFDVEYFHKANEVDVNRLRHKYNLDAIFPVIGVISRFTELKGVQYIIPAFEKLLAEYPDAVLMLFNASGDYSTAITEMLKELPENSYQTIAFETELAALYKIFDVFIQASIDRDIESFGQTYVEALAAGVPSVFTLSGIANDFIRDTYNALVVPYKDSEAIHIAIRRIIRDDKLRKSLAKNGLESVKDRFSLSKMIQSLEALYEI